MKNRISLLIFCLIFWACSNEDRDPIEEIQGEAFTEGQIDVRISMPGNPVLDILAEIYGNIDPSQDIEGQVEEIMAALSQEELEVYMAFQEALEQEGEGLGSLAYSFSMLMLPILDNVIYVKDQEATAKFDALTYHGENRVDLASESGQYFMQSRWNPDLQISYTYTGEALFDDHMQTSVGGEFYQREQTGETEIIAGYLCSKTIYTAVSNPAGPHKLEVWTSALMPESVNFVHPFYVEETGGIMKITVHLISNEAYPIVYEFMNVNSRPVLESELSIQQSEPVYDFSEDLNIIAMQMFGILFGGLDDEDD